MEPSRDTAGRRRREMLAKSRALDAKFGPDESRIVCELDDEWISGFDLAREASLLIHDGQYTDTEYPEHIGWGHSPLSDALSFGRRVAAERLLLFHHDPLHSDDFLDSFSGEVVARWQDMGGEPARVELAAERRELTIMGRRPAASAAG